MMAEQDFTLEMRRRFRRHMSIALLGVFAALVFGGIAAGIAGSLELGSAKRLVVGVAVMSAIAIAPAVGIWSARRNLRCPSCEGALWGMMSFPQRGASSRNCRHCDALIFTQRSTRLRVALVIAGAVLGVAGAAASMLAKH